MTKVILPHEEVESSPVHGIYLIMILLSSGAALFLRDPMVFIFPIFLIIAWVLAASRGTGDVKEDFRSIGITGENLPMAILSGIGIGIFCIILGSVIMGIFKTGSFVELNSIMIPSMANLATITVTNEARIIPIYLVTSVNIFTQWFMIASGEEAAFRVVGVHALQLIYNNPIFAFGGATLVWAALHFPVYLTTGVSSSMYIVLIVVGAIWSAQFVIFRNFFGNLISHAVFNTSVIVLGAYENYGKLDTWTIYTLISIIIVLIIFGGYYAYKNR